MIALMIAMINFRRIAVGLLCLVAVSALAESVSERLQGLINPLDNGFSQDDFLDPDTAFRLSAMPLSPHGARFEWLIAEGYYLYRDKFRFTSLSENLAIDTAAIRIPQGKIKQDESFGRVEVNTRFVSIDVPFIDARIDDQPVLVQVGYQGCKENSICYPPIKKAIEIDLTRTPDSPIQTGNQAVLSAQDKIKEKLKQGGFMLNILAFFTFGLFLSFTPCVFPMIPILSGIIVGQSETVTGRRGFLLSVAYVLAMAATYALLGVLAGSFHLNLQAASQNVWAISAFSLVFILLALSMFGFYELRLPAVLQTRLFALSQPQQRGGWRGAAVMGAVSAVIVGPCVAPPLAGALLYISQTGNALLGGTALFFMGLGFGVPLLVIGASAGSLLPRAGPWMEKVKQVFGVIMAGVAIWFLERVIPGSIAMSLWALLFIVAALFMGALDKWERAGNWSRLSKGIGIVVLVYGVTLLTGAVSGSDNIFKPLEYLTGKPAATASTGLNFQRIKTTADLEERLVDASAEGKQAMLDFYADWCITCIEMEEDTFTDPRVKRVLSDVVLLQADVTANDDDDQQLLKQFQIFGPPAILFFGADKQEMKERRLVGYVKPEQFLQHLTKVISDAPLPSREIAGARGAEPGTGMIPRLSPDPDPLPRGGRG